MSANDRSPAVERLDALADHCIAAREIIEAHDDPFMRLLIDMLLLRIGASLAASMDLDEDRRKQAAGG